ncbi:MAG TPA: hypothetical protein VNU97_09930 [Rhizomicrobium sp.]|nr:hypothetical protein [Rhizomicrobium sp.]
MKSKLPSREARNARAKRAALRALKKARAAVEASGVKLSDWEGEFLGSVEGRVEKYGRAFRDFEKGGPDSSLSVLQAVKLKEIAGKAAGKPDKRPFGQRKRSSFVK